MSPKTILRFLATAVIAIGVRRTAAAQDLNNFERVLVPVNVNNVPGAFGSLWATELWYRNNSTLPVVVLPLAISDYVPTSGRTILLPTGYSPAYAPGQILFISRDGSDAVQFDLRLFNRSDPHAKFGTKLPVVREREFVDAVSLINVPTAADFRIALRIYALPDDSFVGETVLVQILSNDERLLVSTEMPFNGASRYTAVLSLAETYPQIRQAERVRVLVTSTSGRKIWAFVGVTSNTTQDVSIVTPN
ncbi:MAG: hypothetical protein QOC81_4136 [Thermoanaerobaculia bacterium]|nr:hypothetical protein [Thermoanaerobaculia bacterium]